MVKWHICKSAIGISAVNRSFCIVLTSFCHDTWYSYEFLWLLHLLFLSWLYIVSEIAVSITVPPKSVLCQLKCKWNLMILKTLWIMFEIRGTFPFRHYYIRAFFTLHCTILNIHGRFFVLCSTATERHWTLFCDTVCCNFVIAAFGW